jgi:hypothetical protein
VNLRRLMSNAPNQNEPSASPGSHADRNVRKSAGPAHKQSVLSRIAPILAAAVGLLVGLYVGYGFSGPPIGVLPELPTMQRCVADTTGILVQKNPVNAENLRDARDHCYSLIQAQGTLNDFAIRKMNFYQQYRANGVLMWMVVSITFAGVVLAGVQLWASYRLAVSNKTSLSDASGQLILEANRLVLKSSVTGLFILLVSFCFFLVFVFYVYRFEMPMEQSGLPTGQTLPVRGGLGPPPEKTTP